MEKIDQFQFEDALQEDELESRESAANANKRRKKKRRKRCKRFIMLLVILLLGGYFLSDYSNVNVVEMNGNSYYTKQQIMDKAGVSYDMKSIFAPSFLIENRLEKDALIKKASIHKSWDGVIKVKLEEEKLIGYYQKEGRYYLLVDGEKDIEIKDLNKLANVPYLNGLSSKQIKDYKKALMTAGKDNILLISEVLHHETSYDKNMLKLIMQDGHVVYTSFDGLALLDRYTEMLSSLNTNLKCIVFAEEANTMYTEKCE